MDGRGTGVDAQYAETLFEMARRRAWWGRWRRRLTRSCGDLVDAGAILSAASRLPRRRLGRQEVPLDRIVGSTGRSGDFDLAFLPRRSDADGRWRSVARAILAGKPLPPVRLLKGGEIYLVEDGNHRLSVARFLGRETITAEVVELDPAPFVPDDTCTRTGFRVAERGDRCASAC